MFRFTTITFAASLCIALGTITHAQPAPVPTPAPALKAGTVPSVSSALPAPRRIYRKPPNMQIKVAPATNRLVSTAVLNGLITNNLNLNTDALRLRVPTAPPSMLALVVILENGGIRNNIQQPLRSALNVNFRTAVCGNFEFEMRAGEDIVSLVGRVMQTIGGNLHCINPANWRIETLNLLDVIHEQSDLMLENVIKSQNSMLNTQTYYDKVLVLEDANATPAKVIAAMRSIAATHTMDVHVLTHGSFSSFVGHNGASFNETSFFGPLRVDTSAKRMYLRAVYQMNCFSSTLKASWTSLGAVAVNGTENATLNSMPHQYMHFMGYWLQQSQGLRLASQKAWQDAAFYTRPIYDMVGMAEAVNDSLLTVTGTSVNTNVTTPR
jgi:hypothetical protein